MYPHVSDEIPGDVPGINTGFHCTSVEAERTKTLIYQGISGSIEISVEVLRIACGGEWGIRTPDRAFAL
jgi:hypothetical protein